MNKAEVWAPEVLARWMLKNGDDVTTGLYWAWSKHVSRKYGHYPLKASDHVPYTALNDEFWDFVVDYIQANPDG